MNGYIIQIISQQKFEFDIIFQILYFCSKKYFHRKPYKNLSRYFVSLCIFFTMLWPSFKTLVSFISLDLLFLPSTLVFVSVSTITDCITLLWDGTKWTVIRITCSISFVILGVLQLFHFHFLLPLLIVLIVLFRLSSTNLLLLFWFCWESMVLPRK